MSDSSDATAYDSEPLYYDIERHGRSSPVLKGAFKHRRRVVYLSMPFRRYIGLALMAVVFFVIGFVAHKPQTIQVIRDRLNDHLAPIGTSVATWSGAKTHVDPRAIRVRVLNELLQERYPPGSATGIRRQNFVSLDRLADCIENDSCGPGEETVVILASYRFAGAEAGGTGGEEVWARSTMQAFRALNYTIIMTWGHMDTLMVYQRIPEMVPIILWEQGEFKRCQERNDENYLELEKYDIESPGDWQKGKKACMQTEEFPEGIPWWKSFMFLFWAQFGNPLGGKWVVAPEDYTYIRQNDEEHHYLGYSIEHRCMDHVTFSTREHRALILAKNDEYFEEDRNLFVGQLAEVRDQILPATIHGQHVKFDLLSTSGDEIPEGTTKETAEKGIFTIGRQPQKDWVEILARSKVLLGIGRPQLSPSPYDALCLGVPFINPVLIWDHDDPDNRVKWETQQDALKYTNEPYVYHVRAGDKEALASALQRAVDNPIGRYIPEPMRMENVIDRHRYLVEHDWQEEAKAWVHENHPETEQEWKYLTLDMPEYDAYGHIRRP